MILPMLLALQAPASRTSPATDRPIRIWMDAPGQVSRGRGVRLYIQAGAPGNLVVLHSRTDGKIEVLFPARPTDDPHITPGTWEVRGMGDGPIWTVAEPDGTGMILAALTPDPVWFDEFSHDVSWNPDALQPSWSGADAEGGMQDIVQRMLGDGGFTYDVLTYIVIPEQVAQVPGAVPQSADAFQNPEQSQNPDDTFPTVDNTPQDATKLCDVSNPNVYCSYFNDPSAFGRRSRHGHRSGPPVSSLPTPANPQSIAMMVIPIHSAPVAPAARPVQPRRRPVPVPAVPVRNRPADPASTPAPPAVRALASHPVTGAELGRLAGATPAARSAMVLRYVHAPGREVVSTAVTAAPVVERGAGPSGPSGPSGSTTVVANLPVRARGTMLMSRAVSPSAAVGMARTVSPSRAPVTVAPRASGTGAARGWMVIPRRR